MAERATIVVRVMVEGLETSTAETVEVETAQSQGLNDYKTATATPSATTTAIATSKTNKDTKTRAEKQDRKETRAGPGKSTTLFWGGGRKQQRGR